MFDGLKTSCLLFPIFLKNQKWHFYMNLTWGKLIIYDFNSIFIDRSMAWM